MSRPVLDEVLALRGLEPTEFRVLVHLADHANKERIAWPSVTTLAERAELDRRSVQRLLRKLEDAGHLSVETPGGGRNRPTRYLVHPAGNRGTIAPPFTAEKTDLKGDTIAPPFLSEDSVSAEKQRREGPETAAKGRRGDTKRAAQETRNSGIAVPPDPLDEPKSNRDPLNPRASASPDLGAAPARFNGGTNGEGSDDRWRIDRFRELFPRAAAQVDADVESDFADLPPPTTDAGERNRAAAAANARDARIRQLIAASSDQRLRRRNLG